MILDGKAPGAIARAAQALADAQLVAFPTETVYGLGADATSDEAVAKVFAAKGRPADHPLIVHVPGAPATPSRRGRINVSGPGQKAPISAWAKAGTSRANCATAGAPGTCTIRGWSAGRPFAANTFATASSLVASAPRP